MKRIILTAILFSLCFLFQSGRVTLATTPTPTPQAPTLFPLGLVLISKLLPSTTKNCYQLNIQTQETKNQSTNFVISSTVTVYNDQNCTAVGTNSWNSTNTDLTVYVKPTPGSKRFSVEASLGSIVRKMDLLIR